MCDFFWQRLETADQGDLADIVRASGGGRGGRSSAAAGASTAPSSSNLRDPPATAMDSWQQQQQQQQLLHSDQPAAAAAFPPLPVVDDFFGSVRDPLLHELAAGSSTSGFFEGSTEGLASQGCAGGDGLLTDVEMKSRPGCSSSLFSRVLQISPNNKPSQLSLGAMVKPLPPAVAADHSMQISSGPRAPGIKRRKSQAKKVVCIPAPAAASNRPSGEVVPSDLWAWRKYGQKPIKGSPYPRGYYRCSSSKGCSARKQVERSRTDPNMLVITYTSEHNHPWPTQRNALAGSTRSQPTKSGGGASASKTSGSTPNQRMPNSCAIKEEPKESTSAMTTTSSSLARMKEEADGGDMDKAGPEAPLLDDRAFVDRMFYHEHTMDHGSSQPNDFFADLAELDPDPMSLIFSRTDGGEEEEEEEEEEEKDKRKALDSFIDIFDWGGSSFGDHQAKKGL